MKGNLKATSPKPKMRDLGTTGSPTWQWTVPHEQLGYLSSKARYFLTAEVIQSLGLFGTEPTSSIKMTDPQSHFQPFEGDLRKGNKLQKALKIPSTYFSPMKLI